MSLQVRYDPKVDVLYIARPGLEDEVVEVYPGVSLEMDAQGQILGIEILHASKVLRDVVQPLRAKVESESGAT